MTRSLRSVSVVLGGVGIVVSVCVLVGMGCEKPSERLNAPPQGHSDRPSALQEPFVYMTDNAMLADMSMSPAHFVPHHEELNGLGMCQVKRYAQILKIYGGTLRYDGAEDEGLASKRVAQIKEALIAEGLEAQRVNVTRDQAGGEGMNAGEAIQVRKASEFQPGEKDTCGSQGAGKTFTMTTR